jgi:uncharacterized protein (DUF952 family)
MQVDAVIYHIAKKKDWVNARFLRLYVAESLESEGFIHCSTKTQILGTANSFFRGQKDLVLLCIETARVKALVKYEQPEGDTRSFPHIYGPLNIEAVIRTLDFQPETNGTFVLPEPLR